MRRISVGGMSRPPKPAVVKKVAPPSVPDAFRHSGSSFGSGYSSSEDGYLPQPPGDPPPPLHLHPGNTPLPTGAAPTGPPRGAPPGQTTGDPQPPCDHTDVYGMSGKPGSGQFNYPAFTFPGPQGLQYTQLVHAGKGAVYYHPHPATHLPEDQGIDMTQSPGRDSPGSSGSGSTSSGCGGGGGGGRSSGSAGGGSAGGGSAGWGSGGGCRHSTASLDSGRASSGFIPASSSSSSSSGGGSGGSGGGGGSGGSSSGGSHARCSLDSSPRCSLSSSSSIASSSAAEHHHAALFGCGCGSGQGGGAAARVERLMQQGVLPDQDIIQSWLMDLHFEEYFPLFASAGYDMPTISRMTPEDLTAIGIKKPNHRKRLKAEIALLNISDGLPEYIPSSIEEWLGLLGLSEYAGALRQQGCRTVEDVASGVTWEDLEDVGIVRLGHQKKILLAIKRVKDIKAGKRFPQPGAIPPGGDHPINVLLVPPHLQPHIIQQQQQMHQPQEVMITTGGHSPVHECYPASTAPPSSFHTFHRASVHQPPPSSPQPLHHQTLHHHHHQVQLHHRGGSAGYQVRWSRDGTAGGGKEGGGRGGEGVDDDVEGGGGRGEAEGAGEEDVEDEEADEDDEEGMDGEEYQARHRRIQQFLQSSQLPPPMSAGGGGSPSHHPPHSPNTSSAFSPFYFSRPPPPPAPSMCYQPSAYCPDIVPIKIRGGRGKSLESLEDGGTGTSHLTFSGGGGGGGTGFQHHPQMPQLHLPQMQHPMHSHPFYPQPHIHHPHLHYFRGTAVAPLPGWRPRSYDDGDITPTNEGHLQSLLLHHHLHHHSTAFTEGGGTLPRQRSSSTTGGGPVQMPFPTLKPRPVAKIAACTQNIVRFKGDGEAGEEDEDEEDDDDDDEEEEEEGGEEGEDGKGGKKGERKKKKKRNLALMAEFEKQSLQMPPPMPLHACAYKSLPRDLAERDRYFAMAAAGMRKVPPSPPKRNPPPPSVGAGLRPGDGETATHPGAVTTGGDADSDQRKTSPPGQVVGCDSAATASPLMERQQRVTFQQDRVPQSTLSAPQMASGEAMNASGMAPRAVGTSSPPGPAPSSASHRWDGSSSLSDFSEQDGMMGLPGNGGILGMHQNRNGSDASFKSSSSTESDSLPFANENAGTIKQRAARPHPTLSSAMDYPKQEYGTPKRSQPTSQEVQMQFRDRMGNNGGVTSERAAASNQVNCGVSNVECSAPGHGQEPADVLNDIGNMLANLTDELDAMLEEEKRQGLSQ